jgi:hypothetical protein
MSLLQTLKLAPPKHFPLPGGGALAVPPNPAPTAKPAPVGNADAGAGAHKLRGQIEARHKAAAELLQRMQKAGPALKARLDSATGDEKKKLAEQQALLAKKIADAEREVHRAKGELATIEGKKPPPPPPSGKPDGRADKAGASTPDKKLKGGVVSDKDGTGVQGSLNGAKSFTSKSGAKASFSGELHANVKCKIGDPKGDPPRYPVTVTVSFGGSASVSGGAGKKEGKAKGSIELKGSEERGMVATHMLSEAELADYTRALELASKGKAYAAPQRELAIIFAGVSQSWQVAHAMWDSSQTKDLVKNTGDSVKLSESSDREGGVKGEVRGVGAGVKVKDTHTGSKTYTRNEKRELEAETKQEHGREKSGSVSVQAGVVGLEVGFGHVEKTRFGYSIAILANADPDGKILDHLNACKSEEHYRLFLTVHNGKVKLIGKMEGHTEGDSTQIGVSIAGKSLKVGTQRNLDQEVKKDDRGRVVSKTTKADAGAGGELGSRADSMKEEGVAETDKDGSRLTVSRTRTDGKDDKAKKHVVGFSLPEKDLERLGRSARTSLPAWNGWCNVPRDKADWVKAGLAINQGKGAAGVVNHELAKFVGGDIDRMKHVQSLARALSGNKRFEFPESLADIIGDYGVVSDPRLADNMHVLANKSGDAAAAKECQRLLTIVDRIWPRVQACTDFDNKDIKSEMLSRLNGCRAILNQAVLGFSGHAKPGDDPKVLAAEGDRLMALCYAHGAEQATLVARLHAQGTGSVPEKIDGRKLIRQLHNLQQRWRGDWYLLKENYTRRKLVLPVIPYVHNVPQFTPHEPLVEMFEKKFGSI